MSKISQELEVDIKRFFENMEKQGHNDRVLSLKILFEKHLLLNTSDYMLDKHDLFTIISGAKGLFASKNFPIYLGDKCRLVPKGDQANLCVIESTIQHLNNKKCLKKLPKFNYKENKLKE